MATGVVVLTIAAYLLGKISQNSHVVSIWDYLSIALLVPIALFMAPAQRAANIACGDPLGMSNAKCTWANFVWIVLGGLWWLLVLIGMLLPDAR